MSSFGLWECAEEEPEYHSTHAELTYDDVAEAGSPSRPLDFPAPTVSRCSHVDLRARDHRSGTVHLLRNVIMRSGVDTSGNRSNIGYLIKKKMAKTTYGSIRLCIVLKRISRSKVDLREDRQDRPDAFDPEFVEWESTDTLVVIKISEWYKIHSMRGRHLEDPIKEIGALQLLGSYHPHVQGARDALQDDNNLYAVMTYLPGGDLYGRLVEHDLPIEQKGSEFYGFAESRGRVWFRQLLQAVFHLQQKGVCHREISLENILLDENDQLVLIDPGMSLRVPYSDPYNYGCATDASAGGSRLLMIAQGQGGKLMYAPPELVNREEIVDAFAIDLWAVGVVLFVMLVGLAPFKWAHATDQRFSKISEGGLKELMEMFEIPLSPEACDLLQGFFYGDPRKRLTLAEIMTHPWVQGKRFVNTSVRVQGQGKRFVNTSMNAAAIAPKKFTFSLQDLRKPDESPRTSPRRIGKKTKIQQPERSSRRGTVETPPF